jgi:hypothetical protein
LIVSADAESDVPEGAAVFPAIPAELGIDPLLLAVLHAVVFIEGSEENIVNPVAAEEALDHLAGYVQRLSGPQLQKVREDFDCLSAFARQQSWPKVQQRFLKDFLAIYWTEEGKP